MPLYEYGCGACGAVSEISHRISDPAPTDCPACGAPQLSKYVSAAGFRLKGGGWYETDFKSGNKRNLAGDSSSSASSGASDSKSDSKPASTSSTSSGSSGASAAS